MGVLDQAKEVAELVRKYNDLDLYQKIVDLRDEVFKLREENLELRERVKELEAAEDISAFLEKRGDSYYRKHDDGRESGPYCLTCWDADRKLIHQARQKMDSGRIIFACGRCLVLQKGG